MCSICYLCVYRPSCVTSWAYDATFFFTDEQCFTCASREKEFLNLALKHIRPCPFSSGDSSVLNAIILIFIPVIPVVLQNRNDTNWPSGCHEEVEHVKYLIDDTQRTKINAYKLSEWLRWYRNANLYFPVEYK